MRYPSLLLVSALVFAAACAHASAPPATPAPAAARVAPAPDPATLLPGHWTFTAEVAGEQYTGTLDLARGAQGWTAKLVEAQMGEVPASSVVVEGGDVTIQVTAGGGPVTVKGTLQPDGTLAGKVLTGTEEGTFAARKG